MVYKQGVIFAAGLLVGAGMAFGAGFIRPADAPVADTVSDSSRQLVEPVVQSKAPAKELPPQVSVAAEQANSTDPQALQFLLSRIEQAEQRITVLEESLAAVPQPGRRRGAESVEASTAELADAGFDPFVVDTIEVIRNEVQLERLDLRDTATREGWVNSDRFRDAMRDISRDGRLRETLGDQDYDRLLIAEGRSNRIVVDGVIENSAADLAGIERGDIIYRYADERIFGFRDLRRATTAGSKDQPVNVQLLRNNEPLDVVVPRGPLGVTISGVSHEHSG